MFESDSLSLFDRALVATVTCSNIAHVQRVILFDATPIQFERISHEKDIDLIVTTNGINHREARCVLQSEFEGVGLRVGIGEGQCHLQVIPEMVFQEAQRFKSSWVSVALTNAVELYRRTNP